MYKRAKSLSWRTTIKLVVTPALLLATLLLAYHLLVPATVAGETLAAPEGSDLSASSKLVSQGLVMEGEEFAYTILLFNAGDTDAVVEVTDPLPGEIHYVGGADEAYDEGTRTLTWEAITVPVRGEVALTFAVTATTEVPGNLPHVPTVVTNTAFISADGVTWERTATILIEPAVSGHDLGASYKIASDHRLAPGETLTYTIFLYNNGDADVKAEVIDPVPQALNYVAGSASAGGVYDEETQTVSWDDVTVPPGSDGVMLTFAVTGTATAPMEVINTAIISGNGVDFERSEWIWLVTERPQPHSLEPSHKIASEYIVLPGDLLTYTILLANASSANVVAEVSDPLPEEVNYVAGSASADGVYDESTRTLTWSAVTVPAGSQATVLTFAVVVTTEVSSNPTGGYNDVLAITNTAVISADGAAIEREARVWMVSEWPDQDHDLAGSFKFASQDILPPDEVLTYIILLSNSGANDVVAQVTDLLPQEVNYVAGSAGGGGVYDDDAGVLHWDDVTVPAWSDVQLTFDVTATVDTPIEVINTAVISAGGTALERETWVWLVPRRPNPDHNLAPSVKLAAKEILFPGEVLTYTILLHNAGDADAVAQVTDPLPEAVEYIADSATGGGVYDEESRTLTWAPVTVPLGSEVALTFVVTPTPEAFVTPAGLGIFPIEIINTAIISAGGESLERWAWVWLMPERPEPGPDLSGSVKYASHRVLPPGEVLTYTILLHNSGVVDAIADVTDMLPPQVNYVEGSAVQGGVYDPVRGTLSWNGITVPVGGDVPLTFAVTATVDARTEAINTALIHTFNSVGQQTIEVSNSVLLVPERPGYPPGTPVVRSLTIDEQDVLTSPTTTLHISATDDGSVRWMYFREWKLSVAPWPKWEIVQSSGWLPYQAEQPWTLGARNGVHFVGAWVADEANNISPLNTRALDFASLVQPGAALGRFGLEPYLVYYQTGVTVTASLDSAADDAALDVWYLGDLFNPIATAAQETTFVTQQPGTYLFLVYGGPGAVYDLSISPAGGPRSPVWGMVGPGTNGQRFSGQALSGGMNDRVSVLTQNGIDPLNVATAPDGPYVVYLPVVVK